VVIVPVESKPLLRVNLRVLLGRNATPRHCDE
jgi:hypothetical protein